MDERSCDRLVVDKWVTAIENMCDFPAYILDLSTDGCMIEIGGADLVEGRKITLCFDAADHRKSGAIVWIAKGCAGLKFDQPLHEAVLKLYGFTPRDAKVNTPLRDSFGRALPPLNERCVWI